MACLAFVAHTARGSEIAQVVNSVSSSLRYSPMSACLKVTTPVGSRRLASAVDLAETPKPRGVSFIESTTTPLLAVSDALM